MYSDTNLQAANRMRGGLIDPYSGAASVETLPSFYRITPFRIPSSQRPGMHARTGSSQALLPPPGAALPAPVPAIRVEKAGPSAGPPPGALALDLGPPAQELQYLSPAPRIDEWTPFGTPSGTPGSEVVIEFPPVYASLARPPPPPPQRPWYHFW